MAEGQGAEKLGASFGEKEKAVQKFKEGQKEKNPESKIDPKADIINEQQLDAENDKVAKEIAEAAKTLSPEYAGKLTAKLSSVIAGEKAKLDGKLKTINKDSEVKLVTLAAEAVAKLANFKEIPEVKQIYETVKPLFEKKDQIAAISAMQLSSYQKDSGYHKVIDAKFDALGFNEAKRNDIQKVLKVKVDGKVGPETINALRLMLQIGAKKVEFGKKTILADEKTEVDAKGSVIEPDVVDITPVLDSKQELDKAGKIKTWYSKNEDGEKVECSYQGSPKDGDYKKVFDAKSENKDDYSLYCFKGDQFYFVTQVIQMSASAPQPEEKPAEQPKGKSADIVFQEAQAVFKLGDTEGSAYEFFSFDAIKRGNAITLNATVNGQSAPFCDLQVDQMAGTIKFADGTEVPQDKIYDFVKQKLDQHVQPQNLYSVSGEKNNQISIKFAGEMTLQKYTLNKATQKPMKFDVNWAGGNLVLDYAEKTDPPSPIAKVTISENGIAVAQYDDAKILISTEGNQIIASDKPEPKIADPERPEDPKKGDEPIVAEPKPEDSESQPGAAEALKGDIGRLRSELQAKKAEFTTEKLKEKVVSTLTTKDAPKAIISAINAKIDQSGYEATMSAMIAKVGNNLDIAESSKDALAIGSLMGEAESALSKLDVSVFMETPEVEVLTDRLAEPLKKFNELIAKIDDTRGMEDGTEKPLLKTGAAKAALIIAVLEFINDDKAQIDLAALERNLFAAMEEDMPEDERTVLAEAAAIKEWFPKEKERQFSYEGRKPKDGDFQREKIPGTKDQYWLRKWDGDPMATNGGKWQSVAIFSGAVLKDKADKGNEMAEKRKELVETISATHKALIEGTSNLYGDFELSSDGLTLEDSKHSGDHPNAVCEFGFDETTGKITLKGAEVQVADVAGKMREAGDAYIKALEYQETVTEEDGAEYLTVKFKGQLDEYRFQLDDGDFTKEIGNIGENLPITYRGQEDVPGDTQGRVRPVTVATFTIAKNGMVAINLNQKFANTVEAKYEGGENPKITVQNKEEEA